MDKVIDVAFHVTWQSRVFVREQRHAGTHDGPDAALAALLLRWPSTSQSEYAVANRRCVDAIANHGSAEHARNAFVEAAVAAKVLR